MVVGGQWIQIIFGLDFWKEIFQPGFFRPVNHCRIIRGRFFLLLLIFVGLGWFASVWYGLFLWPRAIAVALTYRGNKPMVE